MDQRQNYNSNNYNNSNNNQFNRPGYSQANGQQQQPPPPQAPYPYPQYQQFGAPFQQQQFVPQQQTPYGQQHMGGSPNPQFYPQNQPFPQPSAPMYWGQGQPTPMYQQGQGQPTPIYQQGQGQPTPYPQTQPSPYPQPYPQAYPQGWQQFTQGQPGQPQPQPQPQGQQQLVQGQVGQPQGQPMQFGNAAQMVQQQVPIQYQQQSQVQNQNAGGSGQDVDDFGDFQGGVSAPAADISAQVAKAQQEAVITDRSKPLPMDLFGDQGGNSSEQSQTSAPVFSSPKENEFVLGQEYKKGSTVLYRQRDGKYVPAKVLHVDLSLLPPSYMISVDGAERSTEHNRLKPMNSPQQ